MTRSTFCVAIWELKFNYLGRALEMRTDAMEELLSAESTRLREFLARAKELLKGLPDLARGLCRIQYGKVRFIYCCEALLATLNGASSSAPRKSWLSYCAHLTRLRT